MKYCRNDIKIQTCKTELFKHVLISRPVLFQHLGIYSSMVGKIQKLNERTFKSTENLYWPHIDNPDCKMSTDLIPYKSYGLENAYHGDIFFWTAGSPKKNNFILFEFVNPIIVDQYRIKSGNWNHPLDIIYNATLSIRPLFKLNDDLEKKYQLDLSGNYIVNKFQINEGKVEGSLKDIGAILSMRIDFKSDLENWIIISEVCVVSVDLYQQFNF